MTRRSFFGVLALALSLLWVAPAGGQTPSAAGTLYDASNPTLAYNLYAASFKAGDTITCSFTGVGRLLLQEVNRATGLPVLDANGLPVQAQYDKPWPTNPLVAIRSTYTFTLTIPAIASNVALLIENPDKNGKVNYKLFAPLTMSFLSKPAAYWFFPKFTSDSTGLTMTGAVFNQGDLPIAVAYLTVYNGDVTPNTPISTLGQSFVNIAPQGLSASAKVRLPKGIKTVITILSGKDKAGRPLAQTKQAFKTGVQ